MGRWGRIIRQLLNKRRRKVRSDYACAVFRNYYCRLNRVPGAPIADVLLSAVNVFRNNMILGEMQLGAGKKVDGSEEMDGYGGKEEEDEEEDEDEDEEEDGKEGSDPDFDEGYGESVEGVDPLAMLYSNANDVIEVTTARAAAGPK